MADSSLYEVLGVSPDATAEEIKAAYRRLARELHPDANPDDPSAADRFAKVVEAFETVSDPRQRERYDAQQDAASGIPGEEVEDEPLGAGGWGEPTPQETPTPGSSGTSTGDPFAHPEDESGSEHSGNVAGTATGEPFTDPWRYAEWFPYRIGDMSITPSQVSTPTGTYPLAGTIWWVQEELWEITRRPPKSLWVGLLGSLSLFVFLLNPAFFLDDPDLIFLLIFVPAVSIGMLWFFVKKRETHGWIHVNVEGRGCLHTTHIPAYNRHQIAAIHRQVDYARWLAGTG